MDFNQGQVRVTTLPAHRVLWLAGEHGVQDAVSEALFRAHFEHGQNLADNAVLVKAGVAGGLDGGEIAQMLASDRGGRGRGQARPGPCAGHPCRPLSSTEVGVSGAQPPEGLPTRCARSRPNRGPGWRRRGLRPGRLQGLSRPGQSPAFPFPLTTAPVGRFCDNAALRHAARVVEINHALIGVAGTELTTQERDWLQHDAVAGVVLFKRNFASRQQVTDLSAAIRAAAPRPQLICVDQEGSRVQRFREGYSDLPPLQDIGALYASDPQQALSLAEQHAWLMASEVRASELDLSFAPVVDLGRGNRAIGNRAFSEDPQVVAAFTAAYVRGMHAVGMAATLKHFPGHGTVLEDTRGYRDRSARAGRAAQDLVPFQAGIAAGADAVMMAHVIYPQIAPEPAGYSPRWIQDILRGELGFRRGVLR